MIQGQSKNTKSDSYNTPSYIFEQLDAIYSFSYDAACTKDNCKVIGQSKIMELSGVEYDGLNDDWSGFRVFLNPPFSNKNEWIKKAVYEVEENFCPIVVMILPLNSMSNKVFHEYIIERGYEYEILKGRISFLDDKTKEPAKGNSTGTVICYVRKRIKV